jgi:hypothetical protein
MLFIASATKRHCMDYMQQLAESLSYKMKASYYGDAPMLFFQGRWYSPFFWLQHVLIVFLSVFVAPFLLTWAALMNIRRELRGGYKKAKENWEKQFVKENATPPPNYSI